jgi:hypothetical protein
MSEKNGKNLIERPYQIDEIEKFRKRVFDLMDANDKKLAEVKANKEEILELRGNVKRGHELTEGEELPFQKDRGSRKNDVEEPRART